MKCYMQDMHMDVSGTICSGKITKECCLVKYLNINV